MANDVNPYYTLIQEVINPMYDQITEETPITNVPLIGIIDRQPATGIQIPEGGKVALYQFVSSPCVVIGDSWRYKTGNQDLQNGYVKFKKFTLQQALTEDQMDRIKQNGMNSLEEKSMRRSAVESIAYFHDQITRWAIDPWQGVTTSDEYDAEWHGMFVASNTGTISNPSDINATAGTALDLSTVNLSGTNQSTQAITTLTSQVIVGMTKQDYINHRKIPINQLYMGCSRYTASILRSNTEILDATTKARSAQTQEQLLNARGITVIEDPQFDPDYAYSSAATGKLCFFADPMNNFTMFAVVPPEGNGWTEWAPYEKFANGMMTKGFERHKKMELAFLPQAYWIMTSATAGSMFKPVFWVTITPYENS